MARYPVNKPFAVTTEFGVPDSNALFGKHSGLDFGIPLNRPIYAPCSGTLERVISPTGGNMVRIYDGKYYHRLMHNNSFSRANGEVREGQEVAKAGTTGLSTGVHSHWDVATKKIPTSFADFIDPNKYINIKETDMAINRGRAIRLLRLTRRGVTEDKIKALVGQDEDKWLDSVYKSSWFKEQTAKLSNSVQALKDKITAFIKNA